MELSGEPHDLMIGISRLVVALVGKLMVNHRDATIGNVLAYFSYLLVIFVIRYGYDS